MKGQLKVLLCIIAASILGFVGFWLLEGRQWFEDYAGIGEDYKAGGTSVDD